MWFSSFLSVAFALQGLANPLSNPSSKRATTSTVTSVVNFNNKTGTPNHLASGTLYGLPNNPNQIPSHFFTDIAWNYERAGGAQIPAPGRGWIWGLTEYKNRFQTVLDNYITTRNHGGTFIMLIHDMWGADGTQNSSAPYPGDNGSWASWDAFLDHVFADMKANNMLTAMIVDIWNEPDLGTVFWGRSQAQYLQMWGRTYYKFRAEFGTKVLLSGPATAGEPLVDNTWWQAWCAFVSANQSIPDQYVWHMEGGGGDLLSAHGGLVTLLAEYNLPSRPININEYGTYPEQVPAGSAWWISQLERINAHGLRGNWLSGYELHDFLASLISKPEDNITLPYNFYASDYYPNGDYQVYKYYAKKMTGYRVGTLPSADLLLDSYATVDTREKIARVLVGVRITEGTWELELNSLSSLGLPKSGTLNVHTWAFPVNTTNEHFDEIDHPTDLGTYPHDYTGNSVTFPIYQVDTTTAYAFEFAIKDC